MKIHPNRDGLISFFVHSRNPGDAITGSSDWVEVNRIYSLVNLLLAIVSAQTLIRMFVPPISIGLNQAIHHFANLVCKQFAIYRSTPLILDYIIGADKQVLGERLLKVILNLSS
jgi:hypothetical protein